MPHGSRSPLPLADPARLLKHLEFLTAIRPYRNHKNPESLHRAARYIEREFRETGLSVATQGWEARGNMYENVIASTDPGNPRRFIVGAHYDVYKDTVGADDNASSVAGLLELARILGPQGHPGHGIDLIAYSLEEPPFFKTKQMGSAVHARSVAESTAEVLGMLSLEMIGYYGNTGAEPEGGKFLMVSGIQRFDAFNKKVSELLRDAGQSFGSRAWSRADDDKNNGPSDHRNYWPLGIPAVMVIGTGGGPNPHYHRASDTLDTIDLPALTGAVNAIAHVVGRW